MNPGNNMPPQPDNTAADINQRPGLGQADASERPDYMEVAPEVSKPDHGHHPGDVAPVQAQDKMPGGLMAQPSAQSVAINDNTSGSAAATNDQESMLDALISQAEAIVSRTVGDPYQKSELISELKIKCDYGRDIDDKTEAKS